MVGRMQVDPGAFSSEVENGSRKEGASVKLVISNQRSNFMEPEWHLSAKRH